MIRSFLFLVSCLCLTPNVAIAQNCAGSFPTTLTNGTNADATQVMANFNYLLNCLNALSKASTSVRQTVTSGPINTSGLPSFIPGTSASLNLTSTGVSTTPLTVSAANKNTITGSQNDLIGVSTANITWSALTPNTTNYLYVTVATNGTLSTGKTLLAPIYQWGGTPATTNDQFTFNIGEMRGYMGNGSTAPQAYIVFVGEAVTLATTVQSTIEYGFNGIFESAFTATLPGGGTKTLANHNLGIQPVFKDFVIECTTAEHGFVVGDRISTVNGLGTATTSFFSVMLKSTTTTMTATNVSTQPWHVIGPTTPPGAVTLTPANWKYKFIARRGW